VLARITVMRRGSWPRKADVAILLLDNPTDQTKQPKV